MYLKMSKMLLDVATLSYPLSKSGTSHHLRTDTFRLFHSSSRPLSLIWSNAVTRYARSALSKEEEEESDFTVLFKVAVASRHPFSQACQ